MRPPNNTNTLTNGLNVSALVMLAPPEEERRA
jgi:hypothetical protein